MEKHPQLPRFRPNPARLTPEGAMLLEQVRQEKIPSYDLYIGEGYRPIGGISEHDPFILRRGKILHMQAARNHAGELVIDMLREKYLRRGKNVDIRCEKGAVLLKIRRRQKEVASADDFSYHTSGITIYVKEVPLTLAELQAKVYMPVSVRADMDVTTTVPASFYAAFA